MASSGSLSTTGYKGRHLVLNWSQVSQSIADNTTTISWSLEGAGYASFSYCYARNFTVVINGTTVYYAQGGSSEVKLYNGTVVASGTLVISHDSDGNKSFSASVAAGIYDWSPTCTGSGTFELNKIPRLSSLSANNGTLGIEQTLTVTKQNSSFVHTITYKCGTASGTIVTKSSSTSISWTPPMDLAGQNTTGTLVSITFTIETFSGGASVGNSAITISCSIPDSVRPTCMINTERIPLITDHYDASWWRDNIVYIQGITKVQSSIIASESYGSAIANYTVKMENSTYSGQNVTMNAPSKSGNVNITATVTDKRGRSGSVTKTIFVLPCPSCQITKLTGVRCNSDGALNDRGEYVLMSYAYDSGFYTTEYGFSNGSAEATVYYKKHSDSTWTLLATLNEIQSFPPSTWTQDQVKAVSLFQADTANSYDLKIIVTDYFNTVTMTGRVGTAYSLIHWKASGKGMGIGKTSELDDVLDIGMSTKFSGGITPIEIESGTDLNDVVLPNVYYGNGVSASYPNFPITSASSVDFSIEVLKSGYSTIKQRLTVANTLTPSETDVYERIRGLDSSSKPNWSSWISTSIPGVIPIAQGGTGATTQSDALNNLKALPLAGGTMDAGSRITHPGNAFYWYNGRDGAILRRPNGVSNSGSYYPLVSSKTVNGDWTIGTYGDEIQFNYITDADYNNHSASSMKEFTMGSDGNFYWDGGKTLLVNGTLGASASTVLRANFNGRIFKNLLVMIRSIDNSGNKYSSFVFPTIEDVWGIFLPTYNNYYRAAITISGSGSGMSCLLQMDSNVSGITAWIYATA